MLHGVQGETGDSWRPRVVVPTQGEVWPQPLNQTKSSNTLSLDANTFSFQYDGPCFVVQQALKRYRRQILFQNCTKRQASGEATRRHATDPGTHLRDGHLGTLRVTVSHECEDLPNHHMDESCKSDSTMAAAVRENYASPYTNRPKRLMRRQFRAR
ncbi:hypothetical protein HPB50_017817 [Hyalomma asiaticum]|uniref:Uncharacterized protein n=1 Tax=Hyalomma asiaticum TaxID=266040 RepID=A0ACB7SZS9_HYAAI|nr:hypothetical protein HPB50_017817 [Hyalomma asiaticum]